MYYVYVIKLQNGMYYKGMTKNIEGRLDQHLSGNVRSSRGFLPFKLVHVELCGNRNDARKIEKYFKSGYGREIIEELDC